MSNIVQGDNGSLFQYTVQDDEGIVDLTSASNIEVDIIHKNVRILKTGLITDGKNGKFEVSLDSSDVQNEGIYTMQCTIKFLDNKEFSSDITRFTVEKKI